MSETILDGNPAPESVRQRLLDLRRALLHLHKALLDTERAMYEQVHGRVSSGEFLQLVINHEQFAWLRSISELIVRADEMLDADEPATTGDIDSVLAQARTLLRPSETGDEFQRKYDAALRRNPDAVLARGALTKALGMTAKPDS